MFFVTLLFIIRIKTKKHQPQSKTSCFLIIIEKKNVAGKPQNLRNHCGLMSKRPQLETLYNTIFNLLLFNFGFFIIHFCMDYVLHLPCLYDVIIHMFRIMYKTQKEIKFLALFCFNSNSLLFVFLMFYV